MGKIHFTPKDILQKDFKQKMRGYDPTDVDSFLDMVIRDYENFNKSIQQLQDENDQLRNKIDQLSKGETPSTPNGMETPNMTQTETPNQASRPEARPSQPDSATTINILKRLSNLEKHVFGPNMNHGQNNSQF